MDTNEDWTQQLEQLRAKARVQMESKPRVPPRRKLPDDRERLSDELQLHEIELRLQNQSLRAAHRELEASRNRYRGLYHQAPIGYVTLDPGGVVLGANDTAASMLGRRREELRGRPLGAFLAAESEPRLQEHCQAIATSGQRSWCTVSVPELRSLGQRHLRLDSVVERSDVSATTLLTTLIDVTAEHRARSQAAQLASDLSRAQEIAGQGSFQLAVPLGEEVRWSLQTYAILGRDPQEAEPSYQEILDQVIHPDDREAVDRTFRMAISERTRFDGELRILRGDGSERWVRVSADPVCDMRGRVIGVLGAIHDVHERHVANAAVRDREARLGAILDAAADAIVTVDERGVVEMANPAAVEMFDRGAASMVGAHVDALLCHPEPGERLDGPTLMKLSGRRLLGRREDGSTFPVELSAGAHGDLDGGRLVTAILHDATRQQELQREDMLRQKMEAIGRLASGVAHDFNNLLMGISGLSDIAAARLAGGKAEDLQEILAAIKKACVDGAGLPNQLMTFSRRTDSDRAPVELDTAVSGMKRMLQTLMTEAVELDISLNAPSAMVLCMPSELEQIVMNLAVNARDAMPEGGRLELRTRVVDLDPVQADMMGLDPGAYVELVLRDTGCGIDAATMERIFEPFYTTKERGEGTGLGLSTVYGTVRQLNGQIAAESDVGRGSTFVVRLPRARSMLRKRMSTAELDGVGGTETVLVVEDESLIRFTLRHYLERWGYTMLEAGSAEDALELVAAHDGAIDVLLTDVVLPGMSGPRVALRLAERLPRLQTIFMSAYHPRKLRREGRVPEEAVVLQKPVSESTLLTTLTDVLAPLRQR